MVTNKSVFDEKHVLHELMHFLPSQAPLKDFIHHNTLHAFQKLKFHEGLQNASEIFGYKVYMLLDEYRDRYNEGKIDSKQLERAIRNKKGDANTEEWKKKLLHHDYCTSLNQRTGYLRKLMQEKMKIDLDKDIQTNLFRLIGSYLDQGIALNDFPIHDKGFLTSVRELEKESFGGFFRSKRVKDLLLHTHCQLKDLLEIIVGDEKYFENYLFDQQFSHPGWSGMVAVLENQPESLLVKRKVALKEFIVVELLMEIDDLDIRFSGDWKPLCNYIPENYSGDIFEKISENEIFEVYAIWQEAFEWTTYDQILRGLQLKESKTNVSVTKSFQAIFCIDDRECSFRRYIERADKNSETFSMAGFFNVEFYFQPEQGKFFTKSCPAPLTPGFLIKESNAKLRHQKEAHFSRHNSSFLGGLFTSSTIGFWSAFNLTKSIFYPTESPVVVSSFKHMDKNGKLNIENKNSEHRVHDLQIGFTVDEMLARVEGIFNSIGLVNHFAPIIYFVGHGASSVNNTHYAGYDCGACCGRAGSVNARVAAYMANHPEVRKGLAQKGINIPDTTQFVGALHDTTRDDIDFFDEDVLSEVNKQYHIKNHQLFVQALYDNSKERSRRFLMMDTEANAEKIHDKIRLRSLSLFEPRPEWNHATNMACVIGKRENNKHLFLDRRSFLNSYDYSIDLEGKYLLGILRAVAPVCGGINLEYYFSRNDNYRLGAGTKLPHNVMGLIGVANGMDGDLRTGLPYQMINIHDPLRLLVTVEHFPDVVLQTILSHPPTYEWFINEWVHLVVIHPETSELFQFKDGKFNSYKSLVEKLEITENVTKLIESSSENLSIHLIQQ